MATRKRNEYLEAEESQSEESGYDSEAAEASRLLHTSKRRKTSHDQASEDESHEDAMGLDLGEETPEMQRRDAGATVEIFQEKLESARAGGQTPHDQGQGTQNSERAKSKSRLKENKLLSKPTEKHKSKSGVIYLSRIPPFMKPATVKHLLEPYGTISRVFLTPEDPQSHSARVRHGGNKKRSFVDGWVEFLHKRDAKLVAETLNANIIGGKKGSYYHDDVWNMRYLKGFKWKDLTEQIKNENAERASRLRMEIAQTTRENKRYVESVEKGKMLERMEGKRKQRNGIDSPVAAPASKLENRDLAEGHKRHESTKPKERGAEAHSKKPSQRSDVKTVLDMVL